MLIASTFAAFAVAPSVSSASGSGPEDRKLPMRFAWHEATDTLKSAGLSAEADCAPFCRGWVSAVGTITGDTVQAFDSFARGRDLRGATIVLDSSGGSVLDAISLGRRWRDLKVLTTVGATVRKKDAQQAAVRPEAACESMCVFLLLAGTTRYVPDGARVRVHQIWMGDRADDARAATYSAQDLMIVERDVGRLAKYTFEMGGTGDLLALALSVPPWEPLHELSASELRTANLVTVDTPAGLARVPQDAVASGGAGKPVQDRFAGTPAPDAIARTKTAEAGPTGGSATVPDARP